MQKFWGICFSVLLLVLVPLVSALADDLASLVDTRFPDAGEGKVFRGANVPFGMMMWGPAFSGFSLTFLSGAEMDLGFQMALPILPVVDEYFPFTKIYRGFVLKPPSQDSGEPGYFRSQMSGGVNVELTTTARSGMSRFHFPPSKRAQVLFYLDDNDNAVEVLGSRVIRGYQTRNQIRVFFTAHFSKDMVDFGIWKNLATHRGVRQATRVHGGFVQFDTRKQGEILMKVGMSYVSLTNAELNLETENPNWDFDEVRARARAAWNEKLGLIHVSESEKSNERFFYTHFYQTLMHPNLFSDVNGEYIGFDQQVHQSNQAQGHAHYANFSGWDIYRTQTPLLAMLLPKESSDMMESLIQDANQCGGLPIWPVSNRETGTMAGGSSTPIIASAYAFGAREFDLPRAFELMVSGETDPQAHCQEFKLKYRILDYLERGYIPFDLKSYRGRVAASSTLDYGVADFALSRFAQSRGDLTYARYFLEKSQNWKNIFNDRTGFIQPKNESGEWMESFHPYSATFIDKRGFDEGTASTWSFFVQHNLAALFSRMGGAEKVVERLDSHFNKLNDGSTFPPFPWMGKYAWIGNEPGFGTPWEYNWAGAPWKTQSLIRRELEDVFSQSYAGDEDLGAMSAWVVWAALGLYPEIAGESGLTITSPLFKKTEITLPEGRTLLISSEGVGPYIQNLKINGKLHTRSWVDLSELTALPESRLEFVVGEKPQTAWGTAISDLPPSFDSPGAAAGNAP